MRGQKMSEQELLASLERRLMNQSVPVPISGCRVWLGRTNRWGYGILGFGSKHRSIKAHRAAWILAHGQIPEGSGYHGMVVRHRCDVPACINPHHLELGTQADNLNDTMTRDRLRFGSKHHDAKLSEDDVREILKLKGLETQRSIAHRYGVAGSVISRIFSGKAWRRAAQGA